MWGNSSWIIGFSALNCIVSPSNCTIPINVFSSTRKDLTLEASSAVHTFLMTGRWKYRAWSFNEAALSNVTLKVCSPFAVERAWAGNMIEIARINSLSFSGSSSSNNWISWKAILLPGSTIGKRYGKEHKLIATASSPSQMNFGLFVRMAVSDGSLLTANDPFVP